MERRTAEEQSTGAAVLVSASARNVDALRDLIRGQFSELVPRLREILRAREPHAEIDIMLSNASNRNEFSSDTRAVAHAHYQYPVNTDTYSSFVEIRITWTRCMTFLFPFYATGSPFTGAIACSPYQFVSFNLGTIHAEAAPLANEAFILFANEEPEELKQRFLPWLTVALSNALGALNAIL